MSNLGRSKLSLIILYTFLIALQSISVYAQTETVRINEFMAINESSIVDEDGDFSDWIELFNPTTENISLENWTLTGSRDGLDKWKFPNITLPAGGYMIVFASGKDRLVDEYHSNFNLSGAGEYLALANSSGLIINEFDPFYPAMDTNISYGISENNWIKFSTPTPRALNQETGTAILAPPIFSQSHGFYENAFNLEMTSPNIGTSIYYTLDGSVPQTNDALYTSPIQISKTTIVRAIAVKGSTVGPLANSTYLFLNDIIHQSNTPAGYPSKWGKYSKSEDFAIADYEMDPEVIVTQGKAESVKTALLAIPSVSIITDRDNLFSPVLDPVTGGIYIYPGYNDLGEGWERPVSFEYIDNKNSESFQVNAGVSIQGGASRTPDKSPKHSFRLYFRSEYGPSELNFPIFGEGAARSFDDLTLRAGYNNSWIHTDNSQRARATLINDLWLKDAHIEIGHPGSHSKYVHLYLNGIYWGVYTAAERINDDFCGSYLTGSADDFDVIKDYSEVLDGDEVAWNKMYAMVTGDVENSENYYRIVGKDKDGKDDLSKEKFIEAENLIDYMLINFYGGNQDWDHHNWAVGRNRITGNEGFRFFIWDAERNLEAINTNVVNEFNEQCPSAIFQSLRKNDEFKRLIQDRILKLCFDEGQLTPTSAKDRFVNRMEQLELALDAESARWGDYRRDVHPSSSAPYALYNKQDHWIPATKWIVDSYFPSRTNALIAQLRSEGMYPAIDAPNYQLNGSDDYQNNITSGDLLSMSSNLGTIYYTTNGSDPVSWETKSETKTGEITLISSSSDKRAFVPTEDIGLAWLNIDFDDLGWHSGTGAPGGVGYELKSGYQDLITIDVLDEMSSDGASPNPNNSCYIRIPFTIGSEDLELCNTLKLNMLFDDGFVAYLNGVKVTQVNVPNNVAWNSETPAATEADAWLSYDIFPFKKELKIGKNILAIHGVNRNLGSSDFIINAELIASIEQAAGNISSQAQMYNAAVELTQSSHVKARTFYNGNWSALREDYFTLSADYQDLKITEIHYCPLSGADQSGTDFEFIEIKNTGASTLNLGNIAFTKGVSYKFDANHFVGPGGFIVLANNPKLFFSRYNFWPIHEFEGNLDNIGEKIELVDASENIILSFTYNGEPGWPIEPKLDGYSLVPTEFNPVNNQDNYNNWRSSFDIGGSPGRDDYSMVTVSEIITPETPSLLGQNYPNPFKEFTYIDYQLEENAYIELSVFNMMGQLVTKLAKGNQSVGLYQVQWNRTNHSGDRVPAGVYIYKLTVSGSGKAQVFTNRMLIAD